MDQDLHRPQALRGHLPFDDPDVFGFYAIGLAGGFFAYLGAAFVASGKKEAGSWMK